MCRLEKLDLDKAAASPLPGAMDENATALIELLGTRIGMIMEDANNTALTLGQMDQSKLSPAIDDLVRAGASISIFAAALKDIVV